MSGLSLVVTGTNLAHEHLHRYHRLLNLRGLMDYAVRHTMMLTDAYQVKYGEGSAYAKRWGRKRVVKLRKRR